MDERRLDERVRDRVDVVAEADPLPDRDAVPAEQRDPGPVDRRKKDEEPVECKGREDVEEPDKSRLPRAPVRKDRFATAEADPLTGQDGPCSNPSGRLR
jgi:hypothetical protein